MSLTPSQVELLEITNKAPLERWLMSKEEISDAEKLVKMGYLQKGTADNKQGNRQYCITGEGMGKLEEVKGTEARTPDSDIDLEVERYYHDNEKEVDEAFVNYCFYEGNFEHSDQKRMYHNDRVFWEFVEEHMHKNSDKKAAASLKTTASVESVTAQIERVIKSLEQLLNVVETESFSGKRTFESSVKELINFFWKNHNNITKSEARKARKMEAQATSIIETFCIASHQDGKYEYIESFKNNYIKTTFDHEEAMTFNSRSEADKFLREILSTYDGTELKFESLPNLKVIPHTTKIMGKAESATTGDKLIKKLEQIVEEGQYQKIDGQIVDLSTASAILKVVEHLREKKPESLEKFINMSINQMANIAWKAVGSKTESILSSDMEKKLVEAITKELPDCYLRISKGSLGGQDLYVHFASQKKDWPMGIINNDPLYTLFTIRGWDVGYNDVIEDPKLVKAELITGFKGKLRFPSNKMSPDTLIKKLVEYFKAGRADTAESSILYSLWFKDHEDSKKWQKSSLKMKDKDSMFENAKKLKAQEGWYDVMITTEDEDPNTKKAGRADTAESSTIYSLWFKDHEDSKKWQKSSLEMLDKDSMFENAKKLKAQEGWYDVLITTKDENPNNKTKSQKVDRTNMHNDTGYYDTKNSQYIVTQSGPSWHQVDENTHIFGTSEQVEKALEDDGEVHNLPAILTDGVELHAFEAGQPTHTSNVQYEDYTKEDLEVAKKEVEPSYNPEAYTTASNTAGLTFPELAEMAAKCKKPEHKSLNDLVLDVDDEEFVAHGVNIAHRELGFECDNGYVSYVIDMYGDRPVAELYEVERNEATAKLKTKVVAMNEVVEKARVINSKIGAISGDWEKELDMKFSKSEDCVVDFESTYSNGNDSISLIDMYVFLKDKSLKVKLGICGDTECETDEICGKLISAEYSVDGIEFLPFSHFTEEYTTRKLEEGKLLEAGEKALKEQEKLAKKQAKEEETELKKLKKEYKAEAGISIAYGNKKLSDLPPHKEIIRMSDAERKKLYDSLSQEACVQLENDHSDHHHKNNPHPLCGRCPRMVYRHKKPVS